MAQQNVNDLMTRNLDQVDDFRAYRRARHLASTIVCRAQDINALISQNLAQFDARMNTAIVFAPPAVSLLARQQQPDAHLDDAHMDSLTSQGGIYDHAESASGPHTGSLIAQCSSRSHFDTPSSRSHHPTHSHKKRAVIRDRRLYSCPSDDSILVTFSSCSSHAIEASTSRELSKVDELSQRNEEKEVDANADTREPSIAKELSQRNEEKEADAKASESDLPSVKNISCLPLIELGKLESVKLLARGASGSVYHVRHADSGESYALKKMYLEDTPGRTRSQMEDSVQSEMVASVKVASSPWVATIHQFINEEETVHVLMEFCSRGDLRSFLEKHRRKLSVAQIRQTFAELVLAVESLHARRVVHRDLKPANTLIDAAGHLKLADFDVARTNMAYTPKDGGVSCGTLPYMSPEVLAGEAHNCAVDWWALGCILHEMFTGRTPFEVRGESDAQMSDRIKFTSVVCHKRLGRAPHAFDLVKNLLRKLPAYRLGCDGAEEIKQHPWFDGLDWEALGSGAVEGLPAFV